MEKPQWVIARVFDMGYGERQYLILAPDGNSYAYPAQISEQLAPVAIDHKPLGQIIFEVGRAVYSLKRSGQVIVREDLI